MNKCTMVFMVSLLVKVTAASNYYVSPAGSDINDGTSPAAPFLTIERAISKVVPGDTIRIKGGTFSLSASISISKSGTADKNLYLLAWPGEKPVLNFSGTAAGKRGVILSGSYWVIRGLTITLAGDNGMIISGGGYNLIENCVFAENKDSGLQLGDMAHDNRIINCDSYYNADPPDYGDADGFAPKMNVGSNNYFYGCRSWGNSDDGWDGYLRRTDNVIPTTILENCWTWRNGYLKNGSDPGSQANGNGFKMGGSDDKTLRHNFIVKNCLAFDNKAKGFDQNNNKGSMTVYNGTGFRNGANDFSIPIALTAGHTATVKNCLLARGKVSLGTFVIQEANSWNGSVTVTDADFESLDTTGISGPRKADGSLPDIDFVHLVPGSDLINAGVDVGLPFRGSKPDLGCFESYTTVGLNTRDEKQHNLFNLRVHNRGDLVDISFDPGEGTGFTWELLTLQGSAVVKSEAAFARSVQGKICLRQGIATTGLYLFRLSDGKRSQVLKIKLP